MSKIKTCIVCGKKYEYCGHCDKNGQENRWKINYCSENCRDVFDVISKYANNHISKDDAKIELSGKEINIKDGSNIKKYLDEIIPQEKPVEEQTVEDVETPTEEEEVKTVETTNPFFSENDLNSKMRRRRRVKKNEE